MRASSSVKICALAVLAGVVAARGDDSTSLNFADGTASSGILFKHMAHRSEQKRLPEVMGTGVILADFNRDGAPDVVLINSGKLGSPTRPRGAENRLYLNDGEGRFTDATEPWGLPSPGYGMGGTAGDFDNDGWVDLFLTTVSGPNVLLRNTSSGFVDVTATAGITQGDGWATSAGFLDAEGDGNLDLWVVNYLVYEPDSLPCFYGQIRVYCTPDLYGDLPGTLWRNKGDGTFTDASEEIASKAGNGLALAIGDIDLDGDPDVYVANDNDPNHLWINDGHGGFAERGLPMGVAVSETGNGQAGMGVDMSDVDDDGRVDLAVTNFQDETTNIYVQKLAGLFQDVSEVIGVGRTARSRLSFGIDFFDADNDGDEDLLVANGHIWDNAERIGGGIDFAQLNTLYELADGRFRDVSAAAGPALQGEHVSRGLAIADLDGDGGLDFVISNLDGPPQVALNRSSGRGNFIVLWLEGARANRSAVGARVVARVGDRIIRRQVLGAGSYLSLSDRRVHLGLGTAQAVDNLTVHWPGSEPQTIEGLRANHFYHLVEGQEPRIFAPGAEVIPPPPAAD